MHQFHVSECVLTLQQVECMELLRRLHQFHVSECVLTLQQVECMELLRRLHASVSCRVNVCLLFSKWSVWNY